MAIKNIKGPVPKFKMRVAPVKPHGQTRLITYLHDGMTLRALLESAKTTFGEEYLDSSLDVDIDRAFYDDEPDSVDIKLVKIGPNKEQLEKYEVELAEYNLWKKEYAAEIRAFNAEKTRKAKEAKTARLEKEAKQLEQQLAKVRKDLEHL